MDTGTDGSLLIELFSRAGFGTMFSTDLYSGMRAAEPPDAPAVGELLDMLRRDGIPLPPLGAAAATVTAAAARAADEGAGSEPPPGNGATAGGAGVGEGAAGDGAGGEPGVVEEALPDITVLECEGHVVACAWLRELGPAPDGVVCGELAAFVVHPLYRNVGRGDSLLDYIEQRARERGLRRLALVRSG